MTITEEMVEAAAKVIANSPGIDAPKLPFPCWMGLARAALTAALSKLPSPPDGWRNTATAVLTAAKKHIDPVVQYRLIATIDELLTASPSSSPPDRNAVIEECAKLCDDEAAACIGDIVPGDESGAKLAQARAGALMTAAGDIRALVASTNRTIGSVALVIDREITIKLLPREDGGVRVCSDDMPGLILSGADGLKVLAAIGPALAAIRALKTNPGNAATAP